MIVSINGRPGSGKSTVAKRLAAALGYQRYYIGGMRREMARRKKMTLAEFNKWSEQNTEGDKEYDEYVAELGKTKNNFVIESRTAWHFIPYSVKIFLDVTAEEGARRIWKAVKEDLQPKRNEDSNLRSYSDVLESIMDRVHNDNIRYKKLYGIDIFDRRYYDLYLDTTNIDAEEEYNRVYSFVKDRLDKKLK